MFKNEHSISICNRIVNQICSEFEISDRLIKEAIFSAAHKTYFLGRSKEFEKKEEVNHG